MLAAGGGRGGVGATCLEGGQGRSSSLACLPLSFTPPNTLAVPPSLPPCTCTHRRPPLTAAAPPTPPLPASPRPARRLNKGPAPVSSASAEAEEEDEAGEKGEEVAHTLAPARDSGRMSLSTHCVAQQLLPSSCDPERERQRERDFPFSDSLRTQAVPAPLSRALSLSRAEVRTMSARCPRPTLRLPPGVMGHQLEPTRPLYARASYGWKISASQFQPNLLYVCVMMTEHIPE